MTLDEFFDGKEQSRQLFEAVLRAVGASGSFDLHISKSQVAFIAEKAFGWVWIPGKYIKSTVPLVLSVSLPASDASTRWKQIVEPAPGRFMHHLELNSVDDVDDEVIGWLNLAREFACQLRQKPGSK